MKNAVEELARLIEDHEKEFSSISEHEFNAKPFPEKWSKKEILGHLCDSASNNHRKFIMIKHSTSPVKIESYAQNDWVAANQYQEAFSHNVHNINDTKSLMQFPSQGAIPFV
ncbi:hypothetical protein [Paenibacillus terrae]|uniref:hypothetical protein n=1 Tax=Paenibacillus terrae TaxID=159743 RepID=UPI000697C814|nr:hypothetical protein [Paenibacillus terrae]